MHNNKLYLNTISIPSLTSRGGVFPKIFRKGRIESLAGNKICDKYPGPSISFRGRVLLGDLLGIRYFYKTNHNADAAGPRRDLNRTRRRNESNGTGTPAPEQFVLRGPAPDTARIAKYRKR